MKSRYENLTLNETLSKLRRGNIFERAAYIALNYGGTNGAHHKQWVIDQMLRVLCGNAYGTLIDTYNKYSAIRWDEGIAP